MQLRDFADQLTTPIAKFTQYALNVKHPEGKHKARVFAAALGYTTANYTALRHQIETKALTAEASIIRKDQHGTHLQVDLMIQGLQNQTAIVRTGWLVPEKSNTAFLTTLYVTGTKEND